MAYVLTDGSVSVLAYPYSVATLRRDNPNTSFPASLTDEQLAQWNVFPVKEVEPPQYNPLLQNLSESMSSPDLIDGVWTQVWEVNDLDAANAEIAFNNLVAASEGRGKALLRESDVYVTEAFETSKKLHPDFIAYRALLRNPADLPGYPANTQFPALPANIFSDAVELSADFEETIA